MSSSLYGPFGGTGSGNNIYNSDGSLSNDRQLDGNGNDLTLTNIDSATYESNLETDIDAGTELNLRALNGDVDIVASDNVNIEGQSGIRLRTPDYLASNVNDGDVFQLTDVSTGEGEWRKIYEKIVIWAEEGGPLSNNNLQWSYGNGATGLIGIPLPEEWEAYAFSFHADTSTAGASVTMALINVATNVNITTFTATGATNNMIYTELLATPITIPAGTCLGFRTVTENGTVSDARVAVWLRR